MSATTPLWRRSLLAGVAGTAAMTASSTAEMKLRGREASDAPVKAIERLAGRELPAREALGDAAHLLTGLALGLPRALMERAGWSQGAASAAQFGVAWTPEIVALPALDVVPPPWEWGAKELAISAVHHAVYAAAAGAALALVGPRGG
jgi:hypothetical protein